MVTERRQSVRYLILFYFCVIFMISNTYSVDLPNFIKPCELNNRFNSCLRKLLREVIPKLSDGNPELNLEPIDPLKIYGIPIDFARPYIKFEGVSNWTIKGLGTARINNVKSQFKNDHMKIVIFVTINQVEVESNYEMDGYAFNMVPIKQGNFTATLSTLSTPFIVEGQTVDINGKNYMNITEVAVDPMISNAYFYTTEVLPDRNLDNLLRNIMLREWRGVFEAMLPQAKSIVSPYLVKAANRFFLEFELDELIPKSKLKFNRF